ncbi:MAG: N-6 DNA methylase [Gemmatimonas sp.]
MAKPLHTKVRADTAHASQMRDFLRLVSDVSRDEGWRNHEVLSRWLEASCLALRGTTLRFQPAAFEANEKRYLKIVKTCKDPQETMGRFSHMMGVVVDALEARPSDFLSSVFMEIAADGRMGQFFTPYDLSVVSARMILSDAPALLEEAKAQGRRFISCLEPACGVGGMILAANEVFRDQGIDPSTQVHWDCTDLDWEAVCGCYIQLTLTGASAVVRRGNTLSLEQFDAMPTLMAVVFPKRLQPIAKERAA